ncbi:MAG TPA: hypothetical protein VL326_28315, partial [Kofleriaceae bacterium]|nr:hypothetical protein [Kofleriaceae bacterium]
ACQCDSSAPLMVGPPNDTIVPPTPTFYVFTPNPLHDGTQFVHDIYVKNVATSRPNNTIRTKQLVIDADYIVFEVESDASEGVIELHMLYGDDVVYRYPISTHEVHNRVRPLALSLQRKTDCYTSDEKAVTITLDGNAAAYALEWDDGTKTMLPAIPEWNGASHYIHIGARCGSSNVDLERLHREHLVTLRALFANGTSRVVSTAKLQLGLDDVRAPVELLDTNESFADTSQSWSRPDRTLVIHSTANPTGASIAGGAAAGAGVFVGAALLRARRRRHRNRL